MPHLVLYYTPNIEPDADLPGLCRRLADTMLAARDEAGKAVFPPGGIRVLAYPAAHYALADGGGAARERGRSEDYGFIYLNLRMGRGRSAAVHERVGQSLLETARTQLAAAFERRPLGLTIQIDEGAEVFNGRHSTLHSLFEPKP